MEFTMHRVDLLHGQATSKGTLIVLPVGKKKGQKVAVGDDSGVLTVFYMKKGEVQTEWKSPALGREISSVVLQAGKDKVFLACGQSIHGFTRKGKEFVKIKTNLTETINHLFVDENVIWTGCEYMMNIYDQCKDAGFVTVKDRINALTCSTIVPGDMLTCMLACQDKALRMYSGEKLVLEHAIDGPCTALGYYGENPAEKDGASSKSSGEATMLYGTERGSVTLCQMSGRGANCLASLTDRQQRPGMSGPGAGSRRARVSALHAADIVKSGALDILVGREDGCLEVWSLGDGAGSTSGAGLSASRLAQVPPSLIYEMCLQESVQAVATGNITAGEHNEVVLTTYSGKVLGFSPSQAARDPTGSEMAHIEDSQSSGMLNSFVSSKKKMPSQAEESSIKQEKERRHKALEADVDKLKKELDKEKASYQRLSGEQIAMQTTTKVTHRFSLNSEEACYVLTVDSQAPLELVSLRADVEVDLLDHEGTGAILSRSKGDPANPLLATFRMQETGSRFQIRLRTVEGLHGNISCFVLPTTSPKTAHLVTLAVKPLSLHEKISASEVPQDVPMSQLRLSGPFTTADMHQWLSLCVNELPSRPTEQEMVIAYRSTFVGTVLLCKYTKGSATFQSDSITTISVLKDLITKEATSRKIALSINVDVKDDTFPRFLELIHPKLAFQHSLTQQVRMVEPLREVQLQEGDTQFLAPELQMVIQHSAEIQQQFELQPQRLAFLHNIVIAAYRHKWRLRGYQSVEHRVKDLTKLLENYSMEAIAAFFEEPID